MSKAVEVYKLAADQGWFHLLGITLNSLQWTHFRPKIAHFKTKSGFNEMVIKCCPGGPCIVYKWHAYPGSYTMFGRVGEGLGRVWEGLGRFERVEESLGGFGRVWGRSGRVWKGLARFGRVWEGLESLRGLGRCLGMLWAI